MMTPGPDEDARRREADEDIAEATGAEDLSAAHASRAAELRQRSAEMLAQIPKWAAWERKQPAWDLVKGAQEEEHKAGRAIAFAETTLLRALGRISGYAPVRKALAAFYLQRLRAAEQAGETAAVAKYLDLARSHDDGDFADELTDKGRVAIETNEAPGVAVSIARYEESHGGLLVPRLTENVGMAPTASLELEAGSYLVTIATSDMEVRCPILVRRATALNLHVHIPRPAELPRGMIFIPGGPFLARYDAAQGTHVTREHLPDFAIGRFPVTLREYCVFLDALEGPERQRRTPILVLGEGVSVPLVVRDDRGVWRVDPRMVDGPARSRHPKETDLELPAVGIDWFDAVAYCKWLAVHTGKHYRLPTDLEWEKACRGADGRLFPMGSMLDASFAKRRESRPEPLRPEPAGAFPFDESPYGVRDLAGGVGDMTSTPADGEPLPELSHEHALTSDIRQAIYRGGSWGSTVAMANAMRFVRSLKQRTANVGFRVALSLGESGNSYLRSEPMAGERRGT